MVIRAVHGPAFGPQRAETPPGANGTAETQAGTPGRRPFAHGPTGRARWRPPSPGPDRRNKLCLDSRLFPRASAAAVGREVPMARMQPSRTLSANLKRARFDFPTRAKRERSPVGGYGGGARFGFEGSNLERAAAERRAPVNTKRELRALQLRSRFEFGFIGRPPVDTGQSPPVRLVRAALRVRSGRCVRRSPGNR